MRFLETVFRHRLLAILPVVLGLVVAAGYEMAQPRAFTTSADLWIDTSVPGQSTTIGQYTDPATRQQLAIEELLKSRAFDIAVGQQAGLAAFLGAHPGAETTGLGAVPGLRSLLSTAPGSIDDQLATLVPLEVTIAPTGPQVESITAEGPTPAIAAGIAGAVIQQYGDEVVQAQTASDQLAVTYYSQQLSQELSAERTAEQALEAYLAAHPKVPTNGTGDFTATQLYQVASDARGSYQSLLQQYNSAKLTLESAASNVGFRPLDQPQNGDPVSIKKKLLGAGIAGLLVGLIISLLVMSGLTAADRTAHRAEDVKRVTGLQVAASIDRVAGGTSAIRGSEA